MTRTELHLLKDEVTRKGYQVKQGYCCYQEDGLNTWNLIKIGSNNGSYGWNWSVYWSVSNSTLYISGYRNT